MGSLIDFTGDDTLQSTDSAPLGLGGILLYPAALAVTVVAFIYVMMYSRFLARIPIDPVVGNSLAG